MSSYSHLQPVERDRIAEFKVSFALFADAIDNFVRRRLTREWKTWRDTIIVNFRIVSHKSFRILG
tara:strand:- start:154 stop:348 length:195 start_codon:yes stop_codon:yes gene_type:complete